VIIISIKLFADKNSFLQNVFNFNCKVYRKKGIKKFYYLLDSRKLFIKYLRIKRIFLKRSRIHVRCTWKYIKITLQKLCVSRIISVSKSILKMQTIYEHCNSFHQSEEQRNIVSQNVFSDCPTSALKLSSLEIVLNCILNCLK